jgi:F-type H+-transporting ATPase subunit b
VKNLKFYVFLAILALPAPVLAAETHDTWAGLGWRVLVFVVFMGIMVYLLKDRLRNALGANIATIKQTIADAEQACATAETELAEYNRKMVDMAKELEAMKLSARNTAEKEVELMIAEAERTGEKLREFAKSTIAAETVRATDAIKREMVNLAIAGAEKDLAADTDKAGRQAYIKKTITKIGA